MEPDGRDQAVPRLRGRHEVSPAKRPAKSKPKAEPKLANPATCPHPKAKRNVFGWGTICGRCGRKIG